MTKNRKWSSRVDGDEETFIYKRSIWMEDVVSITDLIMYCIEKNLSPDEVKITKPTLHYETPETDEERERRHQYNREHQERTEKWEREMYYKLKAKFETIHYSDTEDMGS